MENVTTLLQFNDRSECFIIMAGQDDEVFEDMYRQYWPLLLNFAGLYIKDRQTCEEIVQDLFVQIYARGISVKLKNTLKSYLFVPLRNRIFNYLRNSAVYKKHVTNAANKKTASQNNVEQTLYLKELQRSIYESLKQMPVRCREVYLLKQEQLTVKQISQALNRPADTVEKQLRKAKKMLTEDLKWE